MKCGVDKFIEIAAGVKKMNGEIKRLKEIEPLTIKEEILPISNRSFDYPIELSDEDNLREFKEDISALKKKYAPFLKKLYKKEYKNVKEIKNFKFKKEEESDIPLFSDCLKGDFKGKCVSIPHYIGPDGRWNAYYYTKIEIEDPFKRHILRFEAVDYIAEVYLNSRMVKSHTGFFAPFEVDITKYVRTGSNDLFILVKNDYTTTGNQVEGMTVYGDKIYGATHLGYDEPNLGWHHCPSGIGIHSKVYLIECDDVRVTDSFVRTDIETGDIEIRTTINNYLDVPSECDIYYRIEGRNFEEIVFDDIKGKMDKLIPSENYVSFKYHFNSFKLWTPDEPYLYELTITLKDKSGNTIDSYQTHFGMRSFRMDLESKPLKGAFYFNNERIILRGTNEMGHLERCVNGNNTDQLIEDILIAKYAGLNFYRTTQRPVYEKVYTYFDMLGMMCQTDFPIFSYMKYSVIGEVIKETIEMEKLTRNHPSVIIESFSNETLDRTAWGKEQYVISRMEMENVFDSMRKVVEIFNPDRVIKYNEGDYAPISNTYGISDFHFYTYWYISHGLPSGKARKGYLPPIRKDYYTGCGEFGVDALDSYELMKKYAPKEWLPKDESDKWIPKTIAKSQCFQLHSDFFPEEETINDWIKASRNYQKKAIKDYVNLLRYRSDYIEQTAVHLLIDCWPMGWTKALVDVDRIPKPAYYAFKKANEKIRIYLRRDRYSIYNDENISFEVYCFNDTNEALSVNGLVSLKSAKDSISYSFEKEIKPLSTTYLGTVKTNHFNGFLGEVTVQAMMDNGGCKTYDEIAFELSDRPLKHEGIPTVMSDKFNDVSLISEGDIMDDFIFIDSENYMNNKNMIEEKIMNGANVYLYMDKPLKVFEKEILFKYNNLEEEVRANNLIYRNDHDSLTKEFGELSFKNFYNKKKDYQDITNWFKFDLDDYNELLYTLEDTADSIKTLKKKHKKICAYKKIGKGTIFISTLSIVDGGMGYNPVLDKFLINILDSKK